MCKCLYRFVLWCFLIVCFWIGLLVQVEEKLVIFGFGCLVVGYFDDNNVLFEGYINELFFSEQSLLVIQVDYYLIDIFFVMFQLLVYNNSECDLGIEWFYLIYELNFQWLFKVGKMCMFFYYYFDVLDVGFVYFWVFLLQQLYSVFLFN